MKNSKWIIWTVALGLVVVPVVAAMQGLQCPDIVRLALDATNARCDRTDRNQACYGHILLDADPQPGVDNFAFEQEGDIVDLVKLASMRLSPLDEETGLWGVSLMRLQPNVEDLTPGEHVTFLLFGDVEITNAIQAPTVVFDATLATRGSVIVRQLPSVRAASLGTLSPGQTVVANGRLEDSSWLRIVTAETNVFGWIPASQVTSSGDVNALEMIDTGLGNYTPMQAFYFQNGSATPCLEAASGLLVQTPLGMAEITLLMNEVNIQLRATAYVQARPDDEMTISVLEGWADVTVHGETQTVVPGTQVSVPLNDRLAPTAPPGEPSPYRVNRLHSLPLAYLDSAVVVRPALAQEEIPAAIERVNGNRGRGAVIRRGRANGHDSHEQGGPRPGRGRGGGGSRSGNNNGGGRP